MYFFRAVYKQADVYLLDDPLSAVDPHVGKHIFESCIKSIYIQNETCYLSTLKMFLFSFSIDYLRGKTCIIVTQQLQYLISVDKVVLMENVRIGLL